MKALWNPEDLQPRRQRLRLVTTSEGAAGSGRIAHNASLASPSGAAAPDGTLPRRGALTIEDLADLEQLAVIAGRMEEATRTLKQAVKQRDPFEALVAARAVLHVGLLAGDRSRAMERRL